MKINNSLISLIPNLYINNWRIDFSKVRDIKNPINIKKNIFSVVLSLSLNEKITKGHKIIKNIIINSDN